MYLSSIEVQGFKTFAQKTTIHIPKPKNDHKPTTVIVGPNGSGKSNLADAIRWCLGEQSLKQLRGKKHEDIIFSGSTGKGRSGFAEVIMTFDTEPKDKSDISSIAIARHLGRDGESVYSLNGNACRLQDIQLFLAERGIGQRSYSVIGQGMVDHILTASPEERKVFFDDATGVRSLQLKRHQTWLKLKRSHAHLQEVMRLLEEMEPRVRLLKRHMDRLAERDQVNQELISSQILYFGQEWLHIQRALQILHVQIQEEKGKKTITETELEKHDLILTKLQNDLIEKTKSTEDRVHKNQEIYRTMQQKVMLAERTILEKERDIELARIRFETSWAPLPLNTIVQELEDIKKKHEELFALLQQNPKEVQDIEHVLHGISEHLNILHKKLMKPKKEDFVPESILVEALAKAKEELKIAEHTLQAQQISEQQVPKTVNYSDDFLDIQQKSRSLQTQIHETELRMHRLEIDIAREQTKQESLEREMQELDMPVKNTIFNTKEKIQDYQSENARQEMIRLMHKRDIIGGIEENVAEEYKTVSEKFTFLKSQSTDLDSAIDSAKELVKELDTRIESQGEKVFHDIKKAFQYYFKILFDGGSCDLVRLTDTPHEDNQDTSLNRALESLAEESSHDLEIDEQGHIIGIEITATPPGKKMKSLNLLSGGEKAMTSIALLCAIMSVNPSPFVVLDEVDAALDEANTLRFAHILNELQKHSQFIVITHNRATMEQADTLYGVTMNDNGISTLLSVQLTDINTDATTRR